MSNAYMDDGYHSGEPFQSASLKTLKFLNSFWFLKLDYNNNLKTLFSLETVVFMNTIGVLNLIFLAALLAVPKCTVLYHKVW